MAVNLVNVAVTDVRRGDVLSAPEADAAAHVPDRRAARVPGRRTRARRPRPGPPRHPRDPGAPRLARRRLLAAPARAAADRSARRPAGGPADRPAGHPGRRRGARRPPAQARAVAGAAAEAANGSPAGSRADRRPGALNPAPARLAHRARRSAPEVLEPLTASALALERRLKQAGAEPPLDSRARRGGARSAASAGQAIRVSKSLHYHPDALAQIRERVIALAEPQRRHRHTRRAPRRAQTSRKFAQALLEHFDSERLTIRRGDEHVLRRSGQRHVDSAAMPTSLVTGGAGFLGSHLCDELLRARAPGDLRGQPRDGDAVQHRAHPNRRLRPPEPRHHRALLRRASRSTSSITSPRPRLRSTTCGCRCTR